LKITFSESSVSGGVKPKAETVEMKAESKNPSEDLSNQEKNQYWTIYWWGTGTLYAKRKSGSDQENKGPLRRGWTWSGGKEYGGNENTAACLEWLTLQWRKDLLSWILGMMNLLSPGYYDRFPQ